MQNTENRNRKFCRVGGWLYFLILRLAISAVMAVISIIYTPSLGKSAFLPLFICITAAAAVTVILLFLKKRAFRVSYCIFSFFSLIDYVLAQEAMGFVMCMIIEMGWILYLFVSVRVKCVLGLSSPEQLKPNIR